MKRLLILAVLMTGCYWTANAQATLPSSYFVTKAKKQIEAEEKLKYEDLVFVYTENGALTMVIRDGKVEHYPLKKAIEKQVELVVPYYSPIKKEDPVEVWRKNVLLFAELQEKLEAEKFEIYNSFASKDGEVFVYRRRIKK